MNGLRAGFLGVVVLCRSGVRAKFGVNMVNTEESEFSRLVKEKRTGPGWKHSRQKLPRQTVVFFLSFVFFFVPINNLPSKFYT